MVAKYSHSEPNYYERQRPDFVGKVISARDEETGIPLDGRLDPTSRAIHMANFVFVPDNGLGPTIGFWRAMESPSMLIDGHVSANFAALEGVMENVLKTLLRIEEHSAIANEEDIEDKDITDI